MAVEEGFLPVGPTGKALDTTIVQQTEREAHREAVVITDPETLANRAAVVATQNAFSLRVTTEPLNIDGFEGYGEVASANGNNIDIWLGPTAIQPEPVTAGFAPNVISSSASDDTGGAGVSEVTIKYLDTAGAEQVGVFTMNGQTQVAHPSITDCMFVNDFYASALDGALVAAGNIDVRDGTTVMHRIAIAGNWALSTMKQVPAAKRLCVSGWHASSASGAGGKQATVRLRSTSDRFGTATLAGLYLFKDTVILRDSTSGHTPIVPVFFVPALSTVKMSAWTTGASDVAATWRGWLEDV